MLVKFTLEVGGKEAVVERELSGSAYQVSNDGPRAPWRRVDASCIG